jgi:hypothetical protein
MEPIQWGRWWRLAGQAGPLNVLWRDWDPFERGPIVIPGEYDCVTGPLATQLRGGASSDELAKTLSVCRADHLGAGADDTADHRAAESLLAWYATATQTMKAGDLPER